MGQYQYIPLDPSSSEIRMLAILPSLHRSWKIRCKLYTVSLESLDEAPFAFYEALSYTWGDTSDSVLIALNGNEFHVTRNLAAALVHLRARRRPRYLWVDAICINQDDIPE